MFYTLLLIVAVTLLFYVWRTYSYWARKGVPGPTPWPFFGNIYQSFIMKRTVGQIFRDVYSKYDDYPVVGVYRSSDPVLIVRDPEFINAILVKDGKSFFNNDFSVDRDLDPLQGASPFVQKDEVWRATRTMLSPGFTSGKMKNLFGLMEPVNARLSAYLESRPDIDTGHTLETMNLCRRYTLDNVALAAFGIDGKCFDIDDESDFMKLANSFIAPGTFALWVLQVFPFIGYLRSLKVIPKEVENALINIVTDVLQLRKQNNIVANDFLQFVADLEGKKGLNYTEITAHATTFFEDGYETSALVMSYALFNLARNQEAQARVRAEIHQQRPEAITYEDLAEMTYLNACISESMRLCPILEYYTRVCNQQYVYTTSKESPLQRMQVNIDAGTVCIVPFGGLCQDKRYFEEPHAFRPERFLDKDINNKGVFYPFGGGHRICLGQRFGIMQVRRGLIEVLRNFQVTFSQKTRLPFEFLPWTILNKPKHGVWLTYKRVKSY